MGDSLCLCQLAILLAILREANKEMYALDLRLRARPALSLDSDCCNATALAHWYGY